MVALRLRRRQCRRESCRDLQGFPGLRCSNAVRAGFGDAGGAESGQANSVGWSVGRSVGVNWRRRVRSRGLRAQCRVSSFWCKQPERERRDGRWNNMYWSLGRKRATVNLGTRYREPWACRDRAEPRMELPRAGSANCANLKLLSPAAGSLGAPRPGRSARRGEREAGSRLTADAAGPEKERERREKAQQTGTVLSHATQMHRRVSRSRARPGRRRADRRLFKNPSRRPAWWVPALRTLPNWVAGAIRPLCWGPSGPWTG